MKKNRIKLTEDDLRVPETREQAEAVARELAFKKADWNHSAAEMDRQITEIKARYEGRFSALQLGIEKLTMELNRYAESDRVNWGKRKSLELTHAVIGWRTGTPKLKARRGWTIAKVLEAMRAVPKWWGYIRKKEEVDKEGLINDRAELPLAEIGFDVVQEEAFYIEPKLTDTENRVTGETKTRKEAA